MQRSCPRRRGLATLIVPLGLVALGIAALASPAAWGQTEPAKAPQRPWTDPPARSAPSPEAAAAAQPTRPAEAVPPRARKVARAPVASRRPRLAETPRPAETRTRRRIAEQPARAMRRRAVAEIPPIGRGLFGLDERSRRIRAAEEAGFLVVRSRTIEFPDGRRMRTYSPYEPEDSED